jgi:hypothetical protein
MEAAARSLRTVGQALPPYVPGAKGLRLKRPTRVIVTDATVAAECAATDIPRFATTSFKHAFPQRRLSMLSAKGACFLQSHIQDFCNFRALTHSARGEAKFLGVPPGLASNAEGCAARMNRRRAIQTNIASQLETKSRPTTCSAFLTNIGVTNGSNEQRDS